jgi:hypothetical protein
MNIGNTILFETNRNTHACNQALEFPERYNPNSWKLPWDRVREIFPQGISQPNLEVVPRSRGKKLNNYLRGGLHPPSREFIRRTVNELRIALQEVPGAGNYLFSKSEIPRPISLVDEDGEKFGNSANRGGRPLDRKGIRLNHQKELFAGK